LSGGTLSGDLTISKVNPALVLDKAASTQYSVIRGNAATVRRWAMFLGDTVAETGANVGSEFSVNRYDDSGGALGAALTIKRATGVADFSAKPTVAGSVWAAPFDALAFNGMQINGSAEISQYYGSAGTTQTNQYPVDMWQWAVTTTGAGIALASQSQASDVPTPTPGFTTYLRASVATPQPVLGANDIFYLQNNIEGSRIIRLAFGTANAMPITIGFWSCHDLPGLYSVGVRNGTGDRSYVTTYTHNASAVPQYNVITIPGDKAGAWVTSSARGMLIGFAIAAGASGMTASTNIWMATGAIAAQGQVNAMGGSYNSRIGGLIVLPGNEVPTAARSALIMRPANTELDLCERYLQAPQAGGYSLTAYCAAANIARMGIQFRHLMRVVPTLIPVNPGLCGINAPVGNFSVTSFALLAGGAGGVGLDAYIGTNSFTLGHGCVVGMPQGALWFDARI
jgi:hypothetical protein